MLELGIPQGQVISRWKGGGGTLEAALDHIHTTAFTGYLKTTLSRDGELSESLISFSSGSPTIAIHVFQSSGMEEKWYLGDKALEYMWYDIIQTEAVVSLHGEVSLKDLESTFPGAKIRKIEPPKERLPFEKVRSEKLIGAGAEESGKRVRDALGPIGDSSRKRADEQAKGVYDLILQYHKMSVSGQSAGKCKDCGRPVDLLGKCAFCSRKQEVPSVPRMDYRFTFDSYVVGTNSRFAEAAARAVASDPGTLYNPLFIFGRPGLGKTHLLQGIGHHIKWAEKGLNVVYLPLETMETEFIDSLSNKKKEVRDELERADLLLIDDLQFLSGKEKVQEEMLRIMNYLIAKGKQVVLTSDRPPREMTGMGERFVSRIESGLVVDIQHPDADTRLLILRKVVSDEGLNIPDDVMVFVADTCGDSVRQLEGGMNRVIAFASLMRSEITLDMAREVLMHEKRAQIKGKSELVKKHSYLAEEERPQRSYDMVRSLLEEGYRGLIFSRSNPSTIRTRLEDQKATIYWLTEHESKEEKIVHPSLEKIILLVEDFLNEKGDCVVFLDDLQYLISNATFDGVIRFIRSAVDQVSEHQAIFMLSINPESMRSQERSILEREMEPLRLD